MTKIIVQETDTVVVTAVTEGPQGPTGPQGIPGVPGPGALTSIGQLPDVNITAAVEGSVLIYNASNQTFVAGPADTRLTLTDGGSF